MQIPERSLDPPDGQDAPLQFVCDECGEVVPEDEYEGPKCTAQYDQHENAIGVPAHYVDCTGTLVPQTIEPWQDREE